MLEPGELVAGRLRIVKVLGVGGMGSVYEVEHEVTKHRRALKLLHAQFAKNPAVVARFLNEASAAGRIGNPHIVETFDGGQLDSGEPYLVMEMLDGESLQDRIDQRGALPIEEAVALLKQACDGIRAAHEAGIVHRDLKPDNLFVARGEPAFVKILDFGVSKFDPQLTGAQPLTSVGGVLGTPHYMPPEQMRGEEVGPSADVYALGVILYECLTGLRPYDAETLPHLSVLVHEGKPTALTELRPDVPQALARVCERAMATQASQRYQSAEALLDSLELAMDPESLELATQVPLTDSPGPQPGSPESLSRRSRSPDSQSRRSELDLAQRAATERPPPPTVETQVAPQAPRSGSRSYWGAALLLVLGAGVVVAVSMRAPRTQAETNAEPAPAQNQSATVPTEATATAEAQAPPNSTAQSATSAALHSDAAAPSALPQGTAPALTKKPSAAAPATTKPTRASKHGLAEDSPY